MNGGFVLYLAVGRLLIWTGQKFLSDNFKNKFLHKLFSCDLCLGVWVYVILALLFKMTILHDVFPYTHYWSEIITGIISSYVMHIFSIGLREKYTVIVV